jgi:thioredoxin reductase (NADPH)
VRKPNILVVDDDVPVLRAIERDLRARYAADYGIVAAESGAEALEVVRALTRRGDAVALFVVDQRMPVMTGVELLAATLPLQPGAKRVLLTAYADTDAAISAINAVHLDHYILKPWDPPEERLYPVLDEHLADWQAAYRPGFEGLRLLADRWSPQGHAVRDFLTRQQVPYTWLDPQADEEARRLVAALAPAAGALTTVLLPDGRALHDPSGRELAEAIGLSTRAALPFYDLVIVGAGPAGLAAAVYGASEGLKTLVVERGAPGGQAGSTSRIENYLGFPAGLSGGDLTRRALDQARRLGAELLSSQEVVTLQRDDPYRRLALADGSQLACQACLIATGVTYRPLDVPGAEELAGAGLYFGSVTTEAIHCGEEEVGVVGGGNSAGQAAVHLARFARRVHLFVRGDRLDETMSRYLVNQVEALPNVVVHPAAEVTGLAGEGHLEQVLFRSPEGEGTLALMALFVFIGLQPHTAWLEGVVARDEGGFILTGADVMKRGRRPAGWRLGREPFLLETSMPGVFAAGDVRHRSVKRIASAVGEGAMVVQFVHQHLASL